MKNKRLIAIISIFTIASSGFVAAVAANGNIDPALVEIELQPGESMQIDKTLTTPEIPAKVDICMLVDETGSFLDDIHLQGPTADAIYAGIHPQADAYFAVAGFRDYPIEPFGFSGDYVYRLISTMSPDEAAWTAGINDLTASGGYDLPEAQYDAIVLSAIGDDARQSCGWRDDPGVQRILVVVTDAEFHLPGPGKPHINDEASTLAVLNAQGITVIGLKGIGAGTELDTLAAATGGSSHLLSSGGENIAQAILDGIREVTTDVWWEEGAIDEGLKITLTPAVHYNVPGNTAVDFIETISIAEDVVAVGQTLEGTIIFYANSYPREGSIIGEQTVAVTLPDITPPEVSCIETVNPHGKNIPPAGSTTLPGAKGGQNEDGFYELLAEDLASSEPMLFVSNLAGDVSFGPFSSGDKIKLTEASGATPSMKSMGSKKGEAGAISFHIILDSDAVLTAVDDAGNEASTFCYVPKPPK